MRWLRILTFLGSFTAASAMIYGTFFEPNRPLLSEIQIREGPLARMLSGRTAVLVSDLHLGAAPDPAVEAALRMVAEIQPDLILLAGDYVEWGSGREAYEVALRCLSQLHAPLGVYGVLGDADRTSSRNSCLLCHEPGSGARSTRHRVTFLKNSSRSIDLPNGRIRIAGLEPGFLRPAGGRLDALLAGETPTILLSHSSKIYDGIDAAQHVLTLSGDTHGGQIMLPQWLWRIARLKPDPRHVHGYFRDRNKALFVARGVGTSHVRFRLGAPPEIALFRFSGNAQ